MDGTTPFDPDRFSTRVLCRAMLERNREAICTRNAMRAARKLEIIVTTALELSNRRGFASMSLRDLSRASGVSMGGLYSYFDSKQTLLLMILGEVTAAVECVLQTPPPELRTDPRRRLIWLIGSHLHLTEAMQPWFRFAYLEAKSFPADARRIAVDSEELTESFIAAILRDGAASGAFRVDDATLTAALIKPLLQDWYVKRSKYRRRGVTLERYASKVQQIVLTMCAAAPPGGGDSTADALADGPGNKENDTT